MPDCRGEDPPSRRYVSHVQLGLSRQRMYDELPVNEISTVVDGNPGKVFEAGYRDVEVFANSRYARIGIESRYDGVSIRHCEGGGTGTGIVEGACRGDGCGMCEVGQM